MTDKEKEIQEALKKLEARKKTLLFELNKQNEKKRKMEAQKKFILGGWLVSLLTEDDKNLFADIEILNKKDTSKAEQEKIIQFVKDRLSITSKFN